MVSKLSSNKGMALATLLIITAFLLIIGTGLLTVSSADTNFSARQVKQIQAQNIARAGADAAARYVQLNPEFSATGLSSSPLDNGTYSITLSKKLNAASFVESVLITSTGTVGSINEKVNLTMNRVSYNELFKGVRQTGDRELDLEAVDISHDPGVSVDIEGNVDSLDEIKLYADDQSDPYIIKEINQKPLDPVVVPDYSSYETLGNVNGSWVFDKGNYKTSKLSSNNGDTFTFETKGTDQIIIVNELNMKGNLVINGGGDVHLYILESGDITTPGDVNPESASHLFVYVLPGKILNFQANVETFRAYIYAPNATIQFNSDKTLIAGSIVGEFIMRNDSVGAHGHFYYIPLGDNPEHIGIIGFRKGFYSN